MTKAIIFDCFGVLTGDLWKEFVASLPEDQKQPARELNHALDSGELKHAEFYEKIHNLTGREAKEVEGIIMSPMQKNQPLFDCIAELARHYKIGLLSNISSNWITKDFLNKAELEMFDAMVFSYQIGATKPDKAAYMAIADKLHVNLDECVMVDDSNFNCEGAKRVGMKAILYHDFETLKKDLKSILK